MERVERRRGVTRAFPNAPVNAPDAPRVTPAGGLS